MIKYKNYLFEDEDSSEEFIIEIRQSEGITKSECIARALQRANEYFDSPIYKGEISNYEAEMLGYDTY